MRRQRLRRGAKFSAKRERAVYDAPHWGGAMTAVRQARLEDARAIARIEIETWRTTYAGMLPDRVLLGMSERRQTASWASFLRYRPEDVLVAQQAGAALSGFGNCGPQRDRGVDFAGEVYTLYVQPDAQGQGMGRLLLRGLFARLLDSGHRSALAWVVQGNPARFFYERLGGKQVLRRAIPVGGQPVQAIAYGWRDLETLLGRRAQSRGGLAGDPPRR
jgi:ribosomal protein S18 acetylase RimI-like enzyme